MISNLEQVEVWEDIDRFTNHYKAELRELELKRKHNAHYFVAEKSTKWIVFFAYLALSAVLTVLYLYAKTIMGNVPYLNQ